MLPSPDKSLPRVDFETRTLRFTIDEALVREQFPQLTDEQITTFLEDNYRYLWDCALAAIDDAIRTYVREDGLLPQED